MSERAAKSGEVGAALHLGAARGNPQAQKLVEESALPNECHDRDVEAAIADCRYQNWPLPLGAADEQAGAHKEDSSSVVQVIRRSYP
jgi:hypothetical protein